VRHRRPILFEHQPHLVQHRWHRGQRSRAGDLIRIVTDQAVKGQREFVCGDFGFGANPPLLHDLRVLLGAGDKPDNGVRVADVDGQQHD
jgi:hypothetical protein